MFSVALSHDIDRTRKSFQYISHSLKSLARFQFGRLLYHVRSLFLEEPYWNFKTVIDIENRYGVKSTFFFLNESIPWHPLQISNWKLSLGNYDIRDERIQEMIRYLDSNGWEIGVHGSYRSFRDVNLLTEEKRVLERVVGHSVAGIRQHYLNLDDKTWRLQSKAGFLYDASYGYTRDIGFKGGKRGVFSPPGAPGFFVVPLPLMDICAVLQPWKKIVSVIDEVESSDGVLVLNWHQERMNENEFPGFTHLYIRIIEECLHRGGTFRTIHQCVNALRSI